MALTPKDDTRAFALSYVNEGVCRVETFATPQDESNVTITEPQIVRRMFPIAYGTV